MHSVLPQVVVHLIVASGYTNNCIKRSIPLLPSSLPPFLPPSLPPSLPLFSFFIVFPIYSPPLTRTTLHQHIQQHPIGKLSGGMKRRLSIGMAIVGDPPIVFLDEATAGLDPENKHIVWGLIQVDYPLLNAHPLHTSFDVTLPLNVPSCTHIQSTLLVPISTVFTSKKYHKQILFFDLHYTPFINITSSHHHMIPSHHYCSV